VTRKHIHSGTRRLGELSHGSGSICKVFAHTEDRRGGAPEASRESGTSAFARQASVSLFISLKSCNDISPFQRKYHRAYANREVTPPPCAARNNPNAKVPPHPVASRCAPQPQSLRRDTQTFLPDNALFLSPKQPHHQSYDSPVHHRITCPPPQRRTLPSRATTSPRRTNLREQQLLPSSIIPPLPCPLSPPTSSPPPLPVD
jgi:hypothetical protein